jgi:BirA family transcriptional regulator, biotin operon repressor / biotin---[acetyl-CoA-carboxylase] ligase
MGTTWRFRELAECASTQDLALQAALAGEPGRLAIRADRQTAGRGRDARRWASEPGNLHLSILLRPDAPAATLPLHALLAAVALADAAAAIADAVSLKWPNDLLRHGAKAGGILVDGAAEGSRIAHLVLGFGVNLAHAPELPDRATIALGATPPAEFAARLLARLDHWLARFAAEGFAPVRDAWLAHGPRLGEPVTLRGAASETPGRFAGLAPDGRLLLETAQGGRSLAQGEARRAARH